MAAIGTQGCLPAAPTALGTSAVTHNSVTLSWTPPNSVITGYRILRATGTQPMSVITSDIANTTTQYVDTGVTPATAYSYAVVAVNSAAEGPPSATATTETDPVPVVIVSGNQDSNTRSVARTVTLPATATGLTLTASFDWVTLLWDTMADTSITGYRIWRGSNASNMQVLVDNTESVLTGYVDGTVEAQTTYRYAVAAVNAHGAGPQSSASITTLAQPRITFVDIPGEPLVSSQQHAVTSDTLVSNLGYVASAGLTQVGSAQPLGSGADQAFTTGSNQHGYTLNSVTVELAGYTPEGFSARHRVNISIWNDDNSSVGTKINDLAHVMTDANIAHIPPGYYTSSGNNVSLAKDTKYWIRLEYNTSGDVNVHRSGNDDEDEHGLADWDIHGQLHMSLNGIVKTSP